MCVSNLYPVGVISTILPLKYSSLISLYALTIEPKGKLVLSAEIPPSSNFPILDLLKPIAIAWSRSVTFAPELDRNSPSLNSCIVCDIISFWEVSPPLPNKPKNLLFFLTSIISRGSIERLLIPECTTIKPSGRISVISPIALSPYLLYTTSSPTIPPSANFLLELI